MLEKKSINHVYAPRPLMLNQVLLIPNPITITNQTTAVTKNTTRDEISMQHVTTAGVVPRSSPARLIRRSPSIGHACRHSPGNPRPAPGHRGAAVLACTRVSGDRPPGRVDEWCGRGPVAGPAARQGNVSRTGATPPAASMGCRGRGETHAGPFATAAAGAVNPCGFVCRLRSR